MCDIRSEYKLVGPLIVKFICDAANYSWREARGLKRTKRGFHLVGIEDHDTSHHYVKNKKTKIFLKVHQANTLHFLYIINLTFFHRNKITTNKHWAILVLVIFFTLNCKQKKKKLYNKNVYNN